MPADNVGNRFFCGALVLSTKKPKRSDALLPPHVSKMNSLKRNITCLHYVFKNDQKCPSRHVLTCMLVVTPFKAPKKLFSR